MMMFANKKIAVLQGGPGSEREVSLRSGASVIAGLRAAGAGEVVAVDVQDEHFELPPDIDLAFNMIHGTLGEDGRLQEILDARGVPFTGEGLAGSRLAFDKILSKERFVAHGVQTPAYETLRAGEKPAMALPYVVKAPRQGSSVGVYLCRTPEEAASALREVAQFGDDILVENLVTGAELTVGVLGTEALPIIMIRPKQGFYDYKNKYPWSNPAGAAEHFCPAPISQELTARIQALALAAHRALELEVYSRVDVLLTAGGEPYVLELNTIPGMTESSLLPEAARAAGIEMPQLLERIAELSLARYRNLPRVAL